MSQYASKTNVSAEKTQSEIRATLKRYGADGFAIIEDGDRAVIAFKKAKRSVRFEVRMPDSKSEDFTHYGTGWQRKARTESAAANLWEQACRQRWRALGLGIKAKLEFIESGITTFEEEFFAHIVVKGGQTVYEVIVPQIEDQAGTAPLTLMDRQDRPE